MRYLRRFLFGLIFFSLIAGFWLMSTTAHAAYNPDAKIDQAKFVPNEVIIKYKSQQSPDKLRAKIFEREKQKQTFFGKLGVFGSDLKAKATRQGTPEENLKNHRDIASKLQTIKEEKVFENSGQNVLGANDEESDLDNYYLLKSAHLDVNQAIQEFTKDKTVEIVEPNYLAHTMVEPNDPFFISNLWGMKKIQAPAAWDITTGSESIIVAVVDTGVNYNHEDFDPNLIIKGINTISGNNDPMDDNGHGTHVAGTIGAIGNNGIGVVGVNWRVKIMAVKVLNSGGSGNMATISRGIQYAADNGANVINLSLGGYSQSSSLAAAINSANQQGSIVIASAGNCGEGCPSSDCPGPNATSYPGSYGNTIAVAATDSSDQRTCFSTQGNYVDIAAPGASIRSTSGSGYSVLNGTSMAAPHVSGLAALILANNPSLSPDEVRNILTSTADDLGQAGKDQYFGYGRINAARALGGSVSPTVTPGGPTATPTFTPTPTPTGPTATPTPTVTPGGPTATLTPTPILGQITSLQIQVLLQGINSQKGDKQFTIKIKNESREVDKSQSFSSSATGIYSGTIDLTSNNLEAGTFDVFVKTSSFLQKTFANITLTAGENTLVKTATGDLLKAGDLDNSNLIDQTDTLLLKTAYAPFGLTISPADLNLDSLVNSLDYSLLVSNLAPVPTPTQILTPTLTPTPTPILTSTPTLTPTITPTPSSEVPTSTPTSTLTLTPTP